MTDPFLPSSDQAAAVDAVAGFVVRFGLTVPAILALETSRPVAFVGSQFMHVLTPSIAAFLPQHRWEALAGLLEDRRGIEYILRRIEELDEARSQEDA